MDSGHSGRTQPRPGTRTREADSKPRRAPRQSKIRVTCAIAHFGDHYVARCVEVLAEAHGRTIEEAQANLIEVLQVFFENGGQHPSPSPAFVDILEVPTGAMPR